MKREISPKIMHRLYAAEGYLELGMPKQALVELEAVEDAGPLEATRLFLLGHALKANEQYTEAIEPLHQAAELQPEMYSQSVSDSLTECFRESGHSDLAQFAQQTSDAIKEESLAEEIVSEPKKPEPETQRLEFKVQIQFKPHFQLTFKMEPRNNK